MEVEEIKEKYKHFTVLGNTKSYIARDSSCKTSWHEIMIDECRKSSIQWCDISKLAFKQETRNIKFQQGKLSVRHAF